MNFGLHKYWIAILVFALILIFASSPALQIFNDKAAKHLGDIRAERTKTEQALQHLEDTIAEAEQLNGQINAAEVEKSLAPVDRLQAVDVIEKQALAMRLDHLNYTLSPEQKITVNNASAGVQELAMSTITIKADAPLDTDAWNFVENLRSSLPGRLEVKNISLERIAVDAPPAADNLHFAVTFEWLSNGAAREMAKAQ